MLKKFPIWSTEEEADEWLANADLSEYDLSDAKLVRFELAPKNVAISLRLPQSLLTAIKAKSAESGIPVQRLIRVAIEESIAGDAAKSKLATKAAKLAQGKRARGRAA